MKLSDLQTKIIGTIGPACSDPKIFKKLVSEGLTVARLNFAHANHEEHARNFSMVRKVAKKTATPIGIMQDLPGPKLRVSLLGKKELRVKRDNEVTLTSKMKARFGKRIHVSYPYLSRDLKKGHEVYIADGLIRLVVKSVKGSEVICRVANGGVVRSGNGVNMPSSALSLPAFTKSDERHLKLGLKNQVDFVAISFVGKAQDVKRVRTFCNKRKARPFLIAKIERRQAIQNLPEIINAADGIMVARGDLGVETPFSQIPGLQRDIVSQAHEKGKPVLVATQVLESMIQNPRPTRAEATDIANAILEGADAIMLSGETSIGKFPVETIRSLRQVIHSSEGRGILPDLKLSLSELTVSDIVAREACRIAEKIKAHFIVVPTRSGGTAARVSRFRPSMPVLALVGERYLRRRFSLYHGIQTIPIGRPLPFKDAHKIIRFHLKKAGVVRPGQKVLVVSGAPGINVGKTGMVQLLDV